jgi:aminopeptidase N
MLDALNAPAAPHSIHRSDYQPPDWLVPALALDFDLAPATDPRERDASLSARNGAHDRPLRLNGDGLVPRFGCAWTARRHATGTMDGN